MLKTKYFTSSSVTRRRLPDIIASTRRYTKILFHYLKKNTYAYLYGFI